MEKTKNLKNKIKDMEANHKREKDEIIAERDEHLNHSNRPERPPSQEIS